MIAEKQKPIRKLKKAKNFRRQRLEPKEKSQELLNVEENKIIADIIPIDKQAIQEILDLPPMKFLNMPLKEVAYMSEEERQRLKIQHPNLAEYIFMSQRQRCKFFHEKNLSYRKVMETPGNLPARKIQFKRKFQVRFFDNDECAQAVNSKKSKKEKYNPKLHYS